MKTATECLNLLKAEQLSDLRYYGTDGTGYLVLISLKRSSFPTLCQIAKL